MKNCVECGKRIIVGKNDLCMSCEMKFYGYEIEDKKSNFYLKISKIIVGVAITAAVGIMGVAIAKSNNLASQTDMNEVVIAIDNEAV